MSHTNHDKPGHCIAVIGMAGRFPGAKDIDQYWENLRDGKETIRHFSKEELRATKIAESTLDNPHYVRARGMIEGVEQFDPGFFGLSPRQAEILDPQQRVWLECVQEALEDAGFTGNAPEEIVGVFAGSRESTYLLNNLCTERTSQERLLNLSDWEAHQSFLNNERDSIATRTSYLFNFTGPSINVQSACSTSLVAVAQACWSLVSHQCDVSIAGGVCITFPTIRGYFYREQGIYSPDGHCRAFDANGKGTVFGDGVGAVVLKRLEDALRDGCRIDAIIRGWAVNNDGANKASFTAPSVNGQAEVITLAQAMADIQPDQVSYVEAHGTGTPIGDPMEIAGLTKAFSKQARSHQFCGLGSVKTNIGHLDTAAGIAGFIKTVLALKHRTLPPSLHFERPNPQIDFPHSPFYVVDRLQDWHSNGGPRIAGVSSLGVGGTNCHMVVEEAPQHKKENPEPESAVVVTLSAKTKPALTDLRSQFLHYLENKRTNTLPRLSDIAYTTNTGRSHYDWRLALAGDSIDDIGEKLKDQVYTPNPSGREIGEAGKTPQVGFLFAGQGTQYPGMAKQLYDTAPVFRQTLEQCDDLLHPHLPRPLLGVLFPDRDADLLLLRPDFTQPALFAIEYALAELWRSWDIQPSWVMGHSLGEYVAACVAGVFSLEDALRLVAERGRLMTSLSSEGRMVSVFAESDRVIEYLEPFASKVTIAAYNAPQHVVISGDEQSVQLLVEQFQKENIHCRDLQVSHAFHSPLIEPALIPLERYIDGLEKNAPNIAIISNVSGLPAGDELLTGKYWHDQSRHPVKFTQGIATMARLGCEVFIEIGPHPVLTRFGRDTIPNKEILWLSSLHRSDSNWHSLSEAVGQLYMRGGNLDWSAFNRGRQGQLVRMPTYPFQRERYCVENTQKENTTHGGFFRQGESSVNPMLGQRLRLPGSDEIRFETFYSETQPPYLRDHRLYDTLVVPGASHVAMLLQAIDHAFGPRACRYEDLLFIRPVFVPEGGAQCLQLVFSSIHQDGRRDLQLMSASPGADMLDSEAWNIHMAGKVTELPADDPRGQTGVINIDDLCQRAEQRISGSVFYANIWGNTEGTGQAFKWIDDIWKMKGEAIARTKPPPSAEDGYSYRFHPGVFEASFQVLHCCETFETAETIEKDEVIYVPFSVESLSCYVPHSHAGELWCYAKLRELTQDNVITDLCVLDQSGRILTEMTGLCLRKLSKASITRRGKKDFAPFQPTSRPPSEPMASHTTPIDFCEELQGASEQEQQSLLLTYIQQRGAEISGYPESKFNPASSLVGLLFDSLMAIMLANRIQSELDVTFPVSRLLSQCTINTLCQELHRAWLTKTSSGFNVSKG